MTLSHAVHCPRCAARAADPLANLKRHFLSPQGRAVLSAIAAAGQPVPPKVLVRRCGELTRTTVYAVVAELKARGLIVDDGDGFRLADPDLWAMVRDGGRCERTDRAIDALVGGHGDD